MKLSFNSLFFRIATAFILIEIIVGFTFGVISFWMMEMYVQEEIIKVNNPISSYINEKVDMVFNEKAELKKEDIKYLSEMTKMLNPGIEIFFLDQQGMIINRPKSGKLQYEKIPIEKLKSSSKSNGIDPLNTTENVYYSISPLKMEEKIKGYVYIIKRLEKYSLWQRLQHSDYLLHFTGVLSFVFALSIGVSLIFLRYLTRNLENIRYYVSQFQKGNLKARIPIRTKDSFGQLANSFNAMADSTEKHLSQLEKNDELRRNLIANVSHDLRTPITSIYGITETLLLKNKEFDHEEREKFLNSMLKTLDKTNNLVAELFELSKLETKSIQLDKESFSIEELAQDLLLKFKPEAEKKDILVKPLRFQNFPKVKADLMLIDRVLQNLMRNAIEYTNPKGEISVDFEQVNSRLIVKVLDSGIGIEEKDLSNLFNRYYQVNPKSNHGAGLGLEISQKIMELHDSKIKVQSTPGKGSEFYFELPIA